MSNPLNNLNRFLETLDSYQVTDGKTFDLEHFSPDDDGGLGLDKEHGKALLAAVKTRLQELQELLYANQTRSLLIVLQGMDTAGKDGTIKHVMSGVNPQGVSVTSSNSPARPSCYMAFCGASIWLPLRQGELSCSTAAITRMCWSHASTPNCWKTNTCPVKPTRRLSGKAAIATSAIWSII